MKTLPAAIAGQVQAVVELAQGVLGPDLVGVYLYGSATLGGLQAHSDLDLLVLAARSLTAVEKRALVDRLLDVSLDPPWDTTPWPERPLEVTVVARPQIEPWRFPPAMELQYGEWLRTAFAAGGPLPSEPAPNADLALLLDQVRRTGQAVFGPAPRAAIPPIPARDLARAMVEGVEEIRPGIETGSDTTNGLLTLARMWFTLVTGEIAPKDLAAEWAIARLAGDDRAVVDRARAIYLGEAAHDWRGQESRTRVTGARLSGQVLRASEDAGVR